MPSVITSFYSYEDAAIHAGVMRSQGYDAAVLDEVIGSFYGPLFSNGFRVWVSDEPVTGEEEETEVESAPLPDATTATPVEQSLLSSLVDTARLIVGALMMTGVVVVGLALIAIVIGSVVELKNLLVDGYRADTLVPSSFGLIMLLGCAALFAFGGPLMVRMTHSLRSETSVFGWTVRALVVLWVGAEVFWLGTALLQVLWQMCGGVPLVSSP
jgi:hypothetical protein